ncbi:MAG: histidine phosphatase family protein [Patescibacteria group bacterium]
MSAKKAMEAWLSEAVTRYEASRVVLVTHHSTLQMLMHLVCQLPERDAREMEFVHGSFMVFRCLDRNWSLQSIVEPADLRVHNELMPA